jgi:DNA-3-methyladenine glycosylase
MELDDLYAMTAPEAARRLLGCEFVRDFPEGEARVRIVETEAYVQTDAASHSYNGRTQRANVMFGPAGHLYVYFTYGMLYCMNVVAGAEGFGAGALIRAVEPIAGKDLLRERRQKPGIELTNGPAKLCQALDIDKSMNGHDLRMQPLRLIMRPAAEQGLIATTTRIGISKAADVPWRFFVRNSEYVSKR